MLHLSRGNWLISKKDGPFQIATRTPSGDFTWGPPVIGTFPQSYVVSPNGSRIVPAGTWVSTGGVPVFDATVPGVAYTIAALTGTAAAAFTPGGDTVYVAGDSAYHGNMLLAVDAASGAVLGRTPVGGYWPREGLAVAVDPLRPWLYVAWTVSHDPYNLDSVVVNVYDRRSLRRVATLAASSGMRAGIPVSPGFQPYAWTFVMSPVERRLYLTFNVPWPDGLTYVFKYKLMP